MTRVQFTAYALATLDALQALAETADRQRYVRPAVDGGGLIEIHGGRHPVVERRDGPAFIPNDTRLSGEDRLAILTGPNMAGKSTFMRTIAQVVILAHIGSFVPAASANIALTDRVFTRIGASDDMLTGQSTFMVEMNEVSNIVHNATAGSLILLDEVGRGTGTSDGLALARAVIEFITSKIKANTMFATHFHELTALEGASENILNYKVIVQEIEGDIVFLHKVARGAEQNSFGIEVAKISGLPKEIVESAKKLLKK
jgi:DNA mismatch repair protein MutS